MRDLEQFRIINQIEIKIIDSSISRLNPKLHDFVIQKSKNLYTLLTMSNSQKKFPSIFLISDELRTLIDSLSHLEELVAAGLYLGFIKKSEFFLSLEGAEYFYHNNLIPNNRLLIINKEGEKSILYGNDILKEMVVQFPSNLQCDNMYFIINEQDELLAISLVKLSFNDVAHLKPKEVIAQNLTDKGKYLREKQ